MNEGDLREMRRSLGGLWGLTLLLVGGGAGLVVGLVIGYGIRDHISRFIGA